MKNEKDLKRFKNVRITQDTEKMIVELSQFGLNISELCRDGIDRAVREKLEQIRNIKAND